MPSRIFSFLAEKHASLAAVPSKSHSTSPASSASILSHTCPQRMQQKLKTKPVRENQHKEKKNKAFQREHDNSGILALKRHGLIRGSCHPGKHERNQRTKLGTQRSAILTFTIESLPLLLIGPPTTPQTGGSSGAMFSSQLHLSVLLPTLSIKTYETKLVCITRHNHPVKRKCYDCTVTSADLHTWTHIPKPHTYKKGKYSRPIQYLFSGVRPATVHQGALATIEYRLQTRIVTSDGEEIKDNRELLVRRAIPPTKEKHLVRNFPPTSLAIKLDVVPVIYPIGETLITSRVDGMTEKSENITLRWQVRKIIWTIEEIHQSISLACPKHAGRLEALDIQQEDIRRVGRAELKEGWKSDFDAGTMEMEFKVAVNPSLNPICDFEAQDGHIVRHALFIEMIIREEQAKTARPHKFTSTGAAKILRTRFNLALTERIGTSIAWDDEIPILYGKVPLGPPDYDENLPDYNEDEFVDY